jgi:hypothetical protein
MLHAAFMWQPDIHDLSVMQEGRIAVLEISPPADIAEELWGRLHLADD